MRFRLEGSPYVGLFAVCTESAVLLPSSASEELVVEIERALKVEVAVRTSVAEMSLLGCLAVGNSNGFLLSPYALESELRRVKERVEGEGLGKISRLPGAGGERDKMNAVGNLVLANDSVALVHPELSEKTVEEVRETLGVKVYKGTVGGLKTVGMAAVATNKGVLANSNASRAELEFLEQVFELPVEIGSVNFGAPLVGAGLVANTKGYVAGAETTGAELGRIEEALGLGVLFEGEENGIKSEK